MYVASYSARTRSLFRVRLVVLRLRSSDVARLLATTATTSSTTSSSSATTTAAAADDDDAASTARSSSSTASTTAAADAAPVLAVRAVSLQSQQLQPCHLAELRNLNRVQLPPPSTPRKGVFETKHDIEEAGECQLYAACKHQCRAEVVLA